MLRFEYKVVPAPVKADRAKGIKGTQARFAHALAGLMNEMGRDGWEYQRADTLPCEERHGLTGKTTTFQNMLIFRRVLEEEAKAPVAPALVASPPPALESIAARAAATLSVDAAEGVAPAIAPPTEGVAPALGPAGADVPARQNGVAAE